MITLTRLEKIYRTKELETVALENVNLTVNKGEFLSIMGPSGCGKSTLLNIMGLLDLPTSGTVEIASSPYYIARMFPRKNVARLLLPYWRRLVFPTVCAISPRNFPEDNASVWPLPVPLSGIRRLSWPMSRPVTWIPRWVPRSWRSCTN